MQGGWVLGLWGMTSPDLSWAPKDEGSQPWEMLGEEPSGQRQPRDRQGFSTFEQWKRGQCGWNTRKWRDPGKMILKKLKGIWTCGLWEVLRASLDFIPLSVEATHHTLLMIWFCICSEPFWRAWVQTGMKGEPVKTYLLLKYFLPSFSAIKKYLVLGIWPYVLAHYQKLFMKCYLVSVTLFKQVETYTLKLC